MWAVPRRRRTFGTTYYFSATGSNANNGLSPATAKQTIAAANGLSLNAGDTIAFKGGDTFNDATLVGQSNITYTSYGTGKATLSPPNGTSRVMDFQNKGGFTVSNLKITGSSTLEGINCEWTSGTTYGALRFTDIEVSGAFLQGLLFYTHVVSPTIASITITNSLFSGATQCGIKGYFDLTAAVSAITVSGCSMYSNGQKGMEIGAATRRLSNFNISNCSAYSNGYDGIKNYGILGGTWQFISAYSNGALGGHAVGIFPFEAQNVTIQFCESYNNTTNDNIDGDGIDLEACDDCIVQYCYTHGNHGAGLQMYEYSGSPGSNRNTFRYNISINDGNASNNNPAGIYVDNGSGAINNARIYNNLVYNSQSACVRLVGNSPTGFIANNIFQAAGSASQKTGTGGGGMTVDNNVWYGGSGSGYGTNKITTDPLLVSPGLAPTIGIWNPTGLSNYYLNAGSPALNAGTDILGVYSINPGTLDFFGNTLAALPVNLGPYDGAAVAVTLSARVTKTADARVTSAGDTRAVVFSPSVFSGATLDMMFALGSYTGAQTTDLTVTRSGTNASDLTYDQVLRTSAATFAANTPRIVADGRGLLVEESRTQYLGVTAAPATQTTASLGTGTYTLWVIGSGSALASAGTATITGAASASAGSPNTFTVTGAGTVTVTVTGTLTFFQLENGAFPTSYIPNAGASGTTTTRSADVVSLTGTAFSNWYTSASAGTIYAEAQSFGTVSNPRLFSLSDNTTNNLLELYYQSATALGFQIINGGSTLGNLSIATITANQLVKSAGAGASADRQGTANGGAGASNTTAGGNPTVDRAHIGNRADGARSFSGFIRRVAYIPSRQTLSAMQTLTT